MSANIAIIDYGSGNLHSALKAVEYVCEGNVSLVTNAADIKEASHVILPGVGAFGDCYQGLNALSGMREAIEEHAIVQQKPFLGICVGMQLLATKGFENGEHEGLGWIDGEVRALAPQDNTLPIPHMGWNELDVIHDHALLKEVDPRAHVYFVHSYAMQTGEEKIIAKSDYAGDITAIVAKDNIMGTQFHPEKSQHVGLQLLKNFVGM